MPTINLSKLPNEFEMAYGHVIVSMNDDDNTQDIRLVCRVQDSEENVIAFLKQPTNNVGYSHFDISRFLQNYVNSNPNLELTELLNTGSNEVFEYRIGFGYEQNGLITIVGFFTTPYYVLNGRKPYSLIDWNKTPYTSELGSFVVGGITSLYVGQRSKALTDRNYNFKLSSQISDGKPGSFWLSSSSRVNYIDIKSDDAYTLTFLNDWYGTSNPTYIGVPSFTNGINGFYVIAYNGSTEVLALTTINNITSTGGGPNVGGTDEIQPTGEYTTITIQSGDVLTYLNNIDYTHYYIAGWAWSRDPSIYTNKAVITETYRFEKVDNCDDWDNIQVSWTNSFGFRDYFDFTMKSEQKTSVQRNSYTKTNESWNQQTFSVDTTSRMEAIYGQSYEETYSASTRLLNEQEQAYLKNLYLSPDVRVRFEGSDDWYPVVLTSNDYDKKTFRKDKIFQETIEFKLANKNILQSK